MKKLSLVSAFIFSFLLIFPCGWDWDTIQMEKQQFPTVHELITGKFLRHSPELYYWRIRNRTDLIKKYPDSLHYYDDLAWAYDKTGDSKKAIEVMLKKEKKKSGLYETWANLGTFYLHNGQMEEGLKGIRKALEINPDAHFGRERYQLYLAEYVSGKMKDGKFVLPLAKKGEKNYYDYVYEKHMKRKIESGSTLEIELAKAIKGVSGMMTFSNFKSPVLLEALGDLLMKSNSVGGAGHLGSRAYLKASFEVKDEAVRKAYYDKSSASREYSYGPEMHYNISGMDSATYMKNPEKGGALYRMDQLEIALKLEVQSAEMYYDSIRKNEMMWIKEGKNPDSMFALTYYKNPGAVKPVNEYETKKRAGEIDEAYWMRAQLEAPDFIRNIHGYAVLPDSVKKKLDEIYDAEFRVDEENTDQECGLANSKRKEREEQKRREENEKWKFGPMLWLGIAILTGVAGFLFWRMSKRKK